MENGNIDMENAVRKTFKEKLRTAPEQERQLEVVLGRCRALYNTALEQRKTAWERSHVSVTHYGPGSRAERYSRRISRVRRDT